MTDRVDLQFKYSEAEYVAAAKYYLRKTHHTRFSMAVALIVLGIGLAVWALSGDAVFSYVSLLTGAILLLLSVHNYFVLPQRWYKNNPLLREEYRLQFSDEGIAFRTKDVDSTLKWSLYKDVWETDEFYFLLYGRHAFSLIPKRAFADEWQERAFKQMLQQHIAVKSNKKALPESAPEEEYRPKSFEPPDWR